ncbi:MAG: hypothetical protein R2729_32815 [Bryobacteraceae bacterium]
MKPSINKAVLFGTAGCLLTACAAVFGQPTVSPFNWGERSLLVVPMTGAGTNENPRRPLLMPGRGEELPAGIVSIRYEESDDGKFALVEVVARDRKSLEAALQSVSGRPDVRRFDKGVSRKEDIEAEFRGKKRGFDLDRFVTHGNPGRPGTTPATPGSGR